MKKILLTALALIFFGTVGYLLMREPPEPAPDAGVAAEDAVRTSAVPEREVADLVIRNARIHTMDPENPRASSLAIRGDRIIALGHDEETAPLISDATRVINASQGMLLPGFHDAHVHPLSSGHTLLGCSLVDALTVDAILDGIERCAQESAGEGDDAWVVGLDFNVGLFPNGNPRKEMLDARIPDRPVFLAASDGHNAWVNSRALEVAGIDADTANPPKGVIERDPATGEPSGTLRETAQALVADLLPQPSAEDDLLALETAIAYMHRHGITSFIDAAVSERHWKAYRALEDQGKLQARVRTSLTYGTFSGHPGEAFDKVLARRDDYRSEHLDTGAIKLFVDGVLEGETAALVSPYHGEREHRGELNFEPDELAKVVTRFDAMGLQVHMHAIGDRGVRAALDAVAAARASNGDTGNRHHIAHLQLVHPDDVPRFAELGVSTTFQALWAFPDSYITDINLPAVGAERVERMYPLNSVEDTGARIVGGSDWSVSSVNPLDAIETAVRREDPDGRVDGVLNAGEAVSLGTMLAAYTRNAAWLMGHEDSTGSIEVGKKADLVLLDTDLTLIPPEDINEATVRMTLFDGRVVYEAEESRDAAAEASR
jgi:hypothetical protein